MSGQMQDLCLRILGKYVMIAKAHARHWGHYTYYPVSLISMNLASNSTSQAVVSCSSRGRFNPSRAAGACHFRKACRYGESTLWNEA